VSNGPALLSCEAVHRRFGGLHALQGVGLTVDAGEVVGLAGANGAGKSTLLNCIAGQLGIDEGAIRLAGEEIHDLPPHDRSRRGIGRAFQDPRVFPTLTVLQNAALAAVYARPGRVHWRFRAEDVEAGERLLDDLGIADLAQAPAGSLSVFDTKRLMLACALAGDPRILLLDEPAGGLSPGEIEAIVGFCDVARRRGAGVVVVEHVMSFLSEVADRVVVLHEGRNLFEGSPDAMAADAKVRATWLGTAELAA
jgi:ABC-type branched-subunit amino acid transport system ATPase component